MAEADCKAKERALEAIAKLAPKDKPGKKDKVAKEK